jgi:hypothetical protein
MFNLFKKKWPKEKDWPQENLDYDFVDNVGEGVVTSIKILRGKYEDIVYHYGTVRVVEEEDPPRIQFEYTIEEFGNHDLEDLKKDQKFITLLGDILVSIFDNNVLKKERELLDDAPRTDNLEKPDLQ